MKGRVLIIAGSDSGGGAGIQGDIKTVTALGGYAATAITAITVQNTLGVKGVHAVPTAIISGQIHAVLEDIGADVIKTGMLHDEGVINAALEALDAYPDIPRIFDPVMIAKSGDPLLSPSAITALKEKLLPAADLITPNVPEAETLLGCKIKSAADMKSAIMDLAEMGSEAVLLKGGHLPGDVITDYLWDGHALHEWSDLRFETPHTHGTGCTLASAIATGLAQDLNLLQAVGRARDYVRGAITHAPGFGKGHGPLNHGWMIHKAK
jgi:hydroxymethylpyrimidine/phosphomethylpyrimidine kinase